MEAPGKEFIVAYPDQIAFAIKILVGAVIAMGGSMIIGAKWIAGYMLRQVERDFSSIGHKVDNFGTEVKNLATAMNLLASHTAVDIAKINTRCAELHANHRRFNDDTTGDE